MKPEGALRIPVIPGDGVGPELIEAVRPCIEAVCRKTGTGITFEEYRAGYSAYRQTGNPLPEETITAMKNSQATLIGAITAKGCPPPSPVGQLRKKLDLFADIRHCFSVPGSPRTGIDLVMVRECSEGFLSDRNMFFGNGEFMPTPDVVTSVRVITRQKCDAIASLAYAYAQKHGRKKVTVVHKNAVFPLGCGLFRERALEQARLYPEIETEEMFPDMLARELVVAPERFDVILTTNLFGDILSEVVAAQVGNLVPMINAGRNTAMLYPTHGPMMQLAGQQKINPMGMLYTASMMFHWLGLQKEGDLLDRALGDCDNQFISNALVLSGGLKTPDVVKAVVARIDN
ncbi:MAG: isocitrate/isopropylmalate family dehydrogenase [Thermodesulfobacteriota bacterium]